MNRRRFLTQAAAIPALFGLRELFAQEPASGPPAWYVQALERMKSTGRYGVILVVPDPEADRRRLGLTLWTLANEDHRAGHLLFTEAVFICIPSTVADRLFTPSGERQRRFLLDADGTLLAADAVDTAALDDPDKFVASFATFLHGVSNDRLRARAEAVRKTLGDDVKKAVAQLSSESADEREAAQALLVRHADAIAPYLAHEAVVAADVETRGRMGDILARLYATTREESVGPRLPYGSYMPEFAEACGRLRLKEEAMVECGLGRAPLKSRKFIRFLAS